MPKVTIKPSLSNINVIDVVIQDETHTCAAPIVERMNMDPACQFSAYKVEHPNDTFVSIRVQGNEHKNAKTIFKESVRGIIADLDGLIHQIKEMGE